MATREESERRLAEAMRAQATGAGNPGFAGRTLGPPPPPPTDPIHRPAPAVAAHAAGSQPVPAAQSGLWAALLSSRVPLLLALAGGIVLGIALALLSLLAPGVLPSIG